jgi:prevent-host-death family protein
MAPSREIGIRELKARLSSHLKRVQAGVQLTVTDRGRAIARLSPVEPGKDPAWARRMIAERRASWAGGKPAGLHPRAKTKGRPASQMVIEDRR